MLEKSERCPQAVGDQAGGAVGVEQDLGMLVEVAAPGGDLGLHLGEAVLGGHGGAL